MRAAGRGATEIYEELKDFTQQRGEDHELQAILERPAIWLSLENFGQGCQGTETAHDEVSRAPEGVGFFAQREQKQTTTGTRARAIRFPIQQPEHDDRGAVAKLEKLYFRIKQAYKGIHSCRWIATLLGKMTAMIPAIGEALLHVRFLQRDLERALQGKQEMWDNPCPLSQVAFEELNWWSKRPITKR